MDSDQIRYFVPKVLNRLRLYRNKCWKHCNVERIAMRGYSPFASADTLKSQIRAMLGAYDSTILEGIKDEDRIALISTADQAMRHEFDLLGSGPVALNPIDWHTDFKSGVRWDKRYYLEIRGIKGSDIKVPWELSRCQHLLWLGEAYLLTKETKYAKEIIDEINWWIDDNPLMYSVNWTCAMDVAFRAVNWMFALNMISSYEGFDDTFSFKVCKCLWQHGFFIRNNLEKTIPYSNNHYVSDLVGLLYLGKLFSHSCKGMNWFTYGRKEFYDQVRIQVLPSGVHYERSVSYHRLMTELLSYPVYMLMRVGNQVPQEVQGRISSMYDYIAAYTKPNGLSPLIADNDDGRFVPLMKRDFRRHRYLINYSSIENRFVALGVQPLFCPTSSAPAFFQDAGVAVIHKGEDYLYINHSGYSKKPKEDQLLIDTHTHNDLLSFELSLCGEDILVDAGTFLYTSSEEDRNAFRSTAKHNTIVVDGEEQNDFTDSFQIKRNVSKGPLKQMDEYIFEGEYYTINGGLRHARKFDFVGKELVISDTLEKKGSNHTVKLYFHFGAGLNPELNSDVISLNNGHEISFSEKPVKLDIVDDSVSPSFGVLAPSKTAVITYQFKNRLQITTIVR